MWAKTGKPEQETQRNSCIRKAPSIHKLFLNNNKVVTIMTAIKTNKQIIHARYT